MTVGIARFMDALERTWDGHLSALLHQHDVDTALAEATPRCSIRHLPIGTGAEGRDAVSAFLAGAFVGHLPADLQRTRISRTVDRWGLVDEAEIAFTHDRELPWLAPGVAATHREVRALVVAVVRFDGGRIGAQRWLWDQAALDAGLGVAAIPASAGSTRTPSRAISA